MNPEFFLKPGNGEALKVCIFLSGSGTNAEKLLDSVKSGLVKSWTPSLLFTDAPDKSRAFEIGEKYSVPVESLDIREFYRKHGETRVSIVTERGQAIREMWTCELRKIIESYKVDFGILAGFIPLTSIVRDFPCLNVHPGDLTVEENAVRILAGLHTIPVETAILKGFRTLRSSVIVAQPYSGRGGEMDTGPVLGVSVAVDIDMMGVDLSFLREIALMRPAKKPYGGYGDALEDIARHNQENLKENGDWIVFPPAVDDFASGRFALDSKGSLLHLDISGWTPIRTMIYGKGTKTPMPI